MNKQKALRPMRDEQSDSSRDFGGAGRQVLIQERDLFEDEMSDPEYAAEVEKMIQEALDDPRPHVPIDEVRLHFEKRLAEARKIYGQ